MKIILACELHGPHFKNHCCKGTESHFIHPERVLGGFVERMRPMDAYGRIGWLSRQREQPEQGH